MYKPNKRVVAVCLASAMFASGFGIQKSVEAGQSYDSSNVGISNKVSEYLAQGETEDPISDLTAGAVTKETIAAEEAAAAEAATEAEAAEATVTDASPTDTKVYSQFQDRAVVTADSKVNIRTEANGDSEVIGVLDRGGVCLVDEIGPEWTKIESGTCVGYISNDYLAYGDDAGVWCEENGITRRAVINTATLKVREGKDESSDCVTLVPEGEEYYVYSTSGEWTEVSVDDDIRGFVKSEYVTVTFENPRAVSVEEQAEADRIAKEEADKAWLEYLAQQEAEAQAAQTAQQQTAGQTAQPAADQQAQPVAEQPAAQPAAEQPAAQPAAEQPAAEQPAAEQPAEPVAEPATEAATEAPTEAPSIAAPAGSTGIDLANYACQYVGVIPYIWGGSSLSSGVDCSGFTMCVYAQWGYSLPHNAAAQSGYGTEVSLSDLQAGDLLFYSNGGGIGHVAIYIGGGSVVHASNSRDGIKISSYNYRTPVKAVRILGQ